MRTSLGFAIGVLGLLLLIPAASAFGQPGSVLGQTRESAVVASAVTVLDEIMAIPLRNIPQSLLADAEGVAVVPDVVKISFVAGVRRGRGVLLVKDEAGAWTAPQFVTLTGGSVGWQVGVQATDVVLVFKSRRSIQGLLSGTLTLGADAAVAAGPVGRNAAAATDVGLKSEIYTYSRSRGLFAGVSLDGSVLEIDRTANAFYYQNTGGSLRGPGEPIPLPATAAKLLDSLGTYSGSTQLVQSVPADAFRGPPPSSEAAIRQQLADRSRALYAILDDRWKAYLALPGELFEGNNPPSHAALSQSLSRFDTVAPSPQYQILTRRPEFQATHRLLRQYILARTPRVGAHLELPPPPGSAPPRR